MEPDENSDDALADTIAEQIIESQVDSEVEAIAQTISEEAKNPTADASENPDPLRKFIHDLLQHMVERKGSDLLITVGAPASIKIFGEVTPVSNQPLTVDIVRAVVYGLMTPEQRQDFDKHNECNFAISLPVGRFRVNAYVQRGYPGLVARTITNDVPKLKDLNLPPILAKVIMEKRGLLLMVGGTGSGKSTSLAAMIGYRNQNSRGHIITLEDPIEYVHPHEQSIVMQREIGTDSKDWHIALKNTLRQAPDVILIGEVREQDTMEYAIAFAETGHLCLSTLHANSANQALDRIINFFPEERRKQLLTDLSLNMKAIISQRLIPKIGGGRAVAIEILLNSPLVQDLILNGRMGDIKGAMAKSRNIGMQTFDQSLYDLVINGVVEPEIAVTYADSVNNLKLMLRQADIRISKDEDE